MSLSLRCGSVFGHRGGDVGVLLEATGRDVGMSMASRGGDVGVSLGDRGGHVGVSLDIEEDMLVCHWRLEEDMWECLWTQMKRCGCVIGGYKRICGSVFACRGRDVVMYLNIEVEMWAYLWGLNEEMWACLWM